MEYIVRMQELLKKMRERKEDLKVSAIDSGHPSISNKLSQLQEDIELIEKALGVYADTERRLIEVFLECDGYALIHRGRELPEYAVVYGLDKQRGDWSHTCSAYSYAYRGQVYGKYSQQQAFFAAMDSFVSKTQRGHISYSRLEELAVKFKDGLLEDDKESALYYFKNTCHMTEEELAKFGILQEV